VPLTGRLIIFVADVGGFASPAPLPLTSPLTEPVSKSTTNLIEPEAEGGIQAKQGTVGAMAPECVPSRVIWVGSWAHVGSKKGTTHAMIKIAMINRTNDFLLILPPPIIKPPLPTSVGAPGSQSYPRAEEAAHQHFSASSGKLLQAGDVQCTICLAWVDGRREDPVNDGNPLVSQKISNSWSAGTT